MTVEAPQQISALVDGVQLRPALMLAEKAVAAEPMLAGMWGGFTGLLPKLAPMLAKLAHEDHSRFVDRRCLRRVIWSGIRGATLSADDDNALDTSVGFPAAFRSMGACMSG